MSLIPPLDDYGLGKCVHSSGRSAVYAAVRRSDGRDVLLKAYVHDEDRAGRSRAKHEVEVLRQIAGPNVPEGLDLVTTEQTPILVLERVPGISLGARLQSGELASLDFLTIAIQLAEVIGRIHALRLIHRDIHPGNILVEPVSLRAHLVDFGLTRPLGTATHELVLSGSGTYHYISPEQTGRMGRGVDSRSDLYSLGATLYFALTGRAPFEGDDALALIHAHLAKLPVAAIQLRPSIPPTFSRIVAKLLQKTPEDRYQTAHALQRDLCECRDQLQRSGVIENDFPLGSADVPYRPLFSKRIYGRESELAAVRDALARAAQGQPTVLVLRGVPGIGKSALIHELRVPLASQGGYLAHGKFDLYRRDLPYAGFIQALGSFAEQILAESDARLAYWRERFRGAVGAITRVVADLDDQGVRVLGTGLGALRVQVPVDVPLLALERLGHARHDAVLALRGVDVAFHEGSSPVSYTSRSDSLPL